jgi:uncharacterized protein YbjT (DUF2867 family)
MKIVVIGGTGLIGTKLVSQLTGQGHKAVAASPRRGVNTLTGQGLAEALKGAQVIVDVSQSPVLPGFHLSVREPPSLEERAVIAFFKTSTSNLLEYGIAAGVEHLATLSVVGTQCLPDSPYFRAKNIQEKLIKESSIPYSIVQATQFFEFVKSIADFSTKGSQIHVAPVLIQPMAADEVAKAVGRISVGTPANGTVEVGGPEKFRLDELIRRFLGAFSDSREVVADPNALYSGARLSERALVPEDGATLGEIRFEDWLVQESSVAELSRMTN